MNLLFLLKIKMKINYNGFDVVKVKRREDKLVSRRRRTFAHNCAAKDSSLGSYKQACSGVS